MEFPVGVHHYFEEKVCTFHFWLLYVRPKRSWEEYLKLERTHSESAGYVLTFPSEELVKAVLAGGALPKEASSPQPQASSEAKPASAGEATAGGPTQQPASA
jgi:hypothetical protein